MANFWNDGDPISHSDSRMEKNPLFGRIKKDEKEGWVIRDQMPFVRPADFVEQLRKTLQPKK